MNKRKTRQWAALGSALALLVSMSAHAGMSWAWFSDSSGSSIGNIQSATFDAAIRIDGVEVTKSENGTYTADLARGHCYPVTLTAVGTAQHGYCLVSTDEMEAYTNNIVTAEGGYTFTIDLRQDAAEETPGGAELLSSGSLPQQDTVRYIFTPHWGTYSASASPVTFGLDGPVCLENGANVNEFGEPVDSNRPVLAPAPTYEALSEHNIPLYFQNDYPDNRYGPGTIASDGCGVVSLAMIAEAMTGCHYAIPDLARWFGGKVENNIQRFELGATTLGLPWEKAENIDKAIAALYDGKIAVMMMDGFESENPFTTSQHFIVLRGVTTEGRFLVNDPNRQNYAKWELKSGFEKGFTKELLLTGYGGAWIFDPDAIPADYQPYVKDEPAWRENYPGVTLTDEDQELIAKVIWVEAQGECSDGQQAIAEIILNRLISGKFGSTVEGIIYAEGQFRSVPKLEDAAPWQAQYDALDAALYSEPVLDKDVYYFATEALTDNVWGQIGGHVFCRDWLTPEETVPETTQPEETEPGETQAEATEPETTGPDVTQPPETEATESEIEEHSIGITPHEVPTFYQSDYADTPYGDSTVGESGSGIVSLAMSANYLTGYGYTPDQLAAWFGSGDADEIMRLSSAIETLNLPCQQTQDMEAAHTAARENKILILRLESTDDTPSIFTDSVHFIVIRGITEDGKLLIRDPSKENTRKEELLDAYETGFAPEAIFPACTHAWIFDPEALNENFVPYIQ